MRQILGMMAALLVLSAAAPARAQAHHGSTPPPPPAPASRPRVGYAADPPPPPPAPIRTISPVYYYPSGVYVVSGAPYQVLSDGSLLVDFGNGYERVLRQCALVQGNNNGVQVNQTGRDALGRILDPPGIAALNAGSRGQVMGSAPPRNASACYRSDAQGRVEMVTGITGVRP